MYIYAQHIYAQYCFMELQLNVTLVKDIKTCIALKCWITKYSGCLLRLHITYNSPLYYATKYKVGTFYECMVYRGTNFVFGRQTDRLRNGAFSFDHSIE